MIALVTVYDATFHFLGVVVLGLHKYLFDGGVTLEMNLYTILTTYVFNTFHNSFCVRDDNLSYCGLVSISGCGWIAVLIVVVVCLAVTVVSHVCSLSLGVVIVVCISRIVAVSILPFVI